VGGVADAVRAGAVYAQRGFDPGTHGESWHYYLRLLWYSRFGGIVWTEGVVLVLAGVGAVFAWTKRAGGFWPRYLCLYSVITLVAFSAVRYKTPWNLLPFYGGVTALAGFGGARLVGLTRSRTARALLALVLLAACGRLGFQSWLANFKYPADPRNPYVYAQTSPDFLRLVSRVAAVSVVHPDRERMLVAVVAGPYEQWPLPWYLRRMERVGYWTSVAEVGPLDRMPFIVASADFADAIVASLGDRYVSEYYGLRPGVLLTVFIERGLWDQLMGSGRITDHGSRR
jgi:predicted membrane-bound mannosyltransferase